MNAANRCRNIQERRMPNSKRNNTRKTSLQQFPAQLDKDDSKGEFALQTDVLDGMEVVES